MNTTTKSEVSRLAKAAGIAISTSTSSRIRGWGNSSEGLSISDVFPWKSTFQRNNRRHTAYLSDEVQKINIRYTPNTSMNSGKSEEARKAFEQNAAEAMTKLATILSEKSISHSVDGNVVSVWVENPHMNTSHQCSCGKTH